METHGEVLPLPVEVGMREDEEVARLRTSNAAGWKSWLDRCLPSWPNRWQNGKLSRPPNLAEMPKNIDGHFKHLAHMTSGSRALIRDRCNPPIWRKSQLAYHATAYPSRPPKN